MSDWQPIETAPVDTIVDLWIVGEPDTVAFYCPMSRLHGREERAGRTTSWKLHNDGEWRPRHGLDRAMGLSPEVRPTHWMPLPEAPK